jgi:predicted nuclease of predicted toxin-antitoxin system
MSLRIVVDMNLSVEWGPFLSKSGWPTVHWSKVGDPRAEDATIMAWALAEGRVVLTHDLDFGTALALTHAGGPSVLQVRGRRILPEHMGPIVLAALPRYETELSAGALVVPEETRSRARILPLRLGSWVVALTLSWPPPSRARLRQKAPDGVAPASLEARATRRLTRGTCRTRESRRLSFGAVDEVGLRRRGAVLMEHRALLDGFRRRRHIVLAWRSMPR